MSTTVLHSFISSLSSCGCVNTQGSQPLDTVGLLRVIADLEPGSFDVEQDTLYRILLFADMYVALADTSAAKLSLMFSQDDKMQRVHYAMALAVDARNLLDKAYAEIRTNPTELSGLRPVSEFAGQAVAQAIHSLAATNVGLDKITFAESDQAATYARGYLQRKAEAEFKQLVISHRKVLNW